MSIKQNTILVIDDDPGILHVVRDILHTENYRVLTADNAEAGLRLFEQDLPELVICDVNLPDMNGMDICKLIKGKHPETLVMFLSGMSDEVDKVLGLELGAEDYITKPIGMREFKARVRAVLRRLQMVPKAETSNSTVTAQNKGQIAFEQLEMDLNFCQVRIKGQEIDLTRKEFEILTLLASHPGQVFTREHILNQVWTDDIHISDRSIDAHIRRLRDKIEENSEKPYYIETVRGFGYRFRARSTASTTS